MNEDEKTLLEVTLLAQKQNIILLFYSYKKRKTTLEFPTMTIKKACKMSLERLRTRHKITIKNMHDLLKDKLTILSK